MIELGNVLLEPTTDAANRLVVRIHKRFPRGGRYHAAGELVHVETWRFGSEERRQEWLAQQQAAHEHALAAQAARKAERAKPHAFKTGDVVCSSWGYDQTNVDFYVVTRTTAHFVWLRPIAQRAEETLSMQGTCQPETPIRPIGDEQKHKASASGWITLTSYSGASMWDGRPKSWSSYA